MTVAEDSALINASVVNMKEFSVCKSFFPRAHNCILYHSVDNPLGGETAKW